MKRTILHTIETGGPGGAESVLLALASGIDNEQFRSIVLLPYMGWLGGKLQERGVPVFVARSRGWYDLRLLKALVRLVREEKVDLIHSHLPDQNFYACLVGSLTGTKTIVTYHGSPDAGGSGSFRSAIKLRVVRSSADGVVAVSDYLKKSLMDLGFEANQIERIYNGVDLRRFSDSPSGRLRAEFNYHNGIKLIGMVANLRESKGYEFFIRAARKVADSMPNARFFSIGAVDSAIGREMRDLVESVSLQDRFFFLGFRTDVPEILNDLDIFVLSSVSEGFSLATVEAMAAEKPVIVTRSGGPLEIVDDGRTGCLIPPADSDALAGKICELLASPERAAALARMARTEVMRMFSLERMIGDYERLYEGVLNGT